MSARHTILKKGSHIMKAQNESAALDRLAAAWLNEHISDETKTALSAARAAYAEKADDAVAALRKATDTAKEEYAANNNIFADKYSVLQGYLGWEGDFDAPCIWVDGTVTMRDRGNARATFGVSSLDTNSVSWEIAEGYLPCWTSRFTKNGMTYAISHFADCVPYNGNDYEVLYSRLTVTNESGVARVMPAVSGILARMTDEPQAIDDGETVTVDYCVACDRFGKDIPYPEDTVFAGMGTYDDHYIHMKNYWNTRLETIAEISLPGKYALLSDAIKAGYIYTLIISDGYELHVGEGSYDRVFDHDVIGMLATLVTLGHTDHFAEYASTILKNIQYPDAAWKFSFPFAVYLEKTGDFDVICHYWNDIKLNTHKIESEREIYKNGALTLSDGSPAMIMKLTNAIDSQGYWTIDNYAAMFGLLTYTYIADAMYKKYGKDEYLAERGWASSLYDKMLESVITIMKYNMAENGFDYISINMEVPNEQTERRNPMDGNWASMYLFGRWDWDGYLFGADRNNFLADKLDYTYEYILKAKAPYLPSPYTMGGYPGVSSAYNAGYYSAALAGEKYRTYGIEAYMWLLENATSCPFGTWEGIGQISTETVLKGSAASAGSGSCQHMWGQSVNTKVVIDSFLAEKADGTVIVGRGLPLSFNADGETAEISNYLCRGGKRIGYRMTTKNGTVTLEFTGDILDGEMSIELPVLAGNIAAVSGDLGFDSDAGKVTVPAGVREVSIRLLN